MDLWPEDPDDPVCFLIIIIKHIYIYSDLIQDTRIWTHHPDHDEVRTIIGHKENPPEGYYEQVRGVTKIKAFSKFQYKIRVDKYSLEDSIDWMDMDSRGNPDDKDFRHSTTRESVQKKKARKRPRPGDYKDVQKYRRPTHTEEGWYGRKSQFQKIKELDKKNLEIVDYINHNELINFSTVFHVFVSRIDGVDLKLYEIVDYWQSYLDQKTDVKRATIEPWKQAQHQQSFAIQNHHRPPPQKQQLSSLTSTTIPQQVHHQKQQQYQYVQQAPPPRLYYSNQHPEQQQVPTAVIVRHQQQPTIHQYQQQYDGGRIYYIIPQHNGTELANGHMANSNMAPTTNMYWQ
jgi:hypothetical protein